MRRSGKGTDWIVDWNHLGRIKAGAVKRILRSSGSSRRVRRGGRRSRFVTPFLLCASFFLLFSTPDDYVKCTDPFPNELLDFLGLMEIPKKGLFLCSHAMRYAPCAMLFSEKDGKPSSFLTMTENFSVNRFFFGP